MKTRHFCAEEIQHAAIVCKHCGRDVAFLIYADVDALLWTHNPPAARAPRAAEPAWTIERHGVVWEGCFRGHGEWGCEFQLFKRGEFMFGRRYPTRAGAELEAAFWRRDVEAGLFDRTPAP